VPRARTPPPRAPGVPERTRGVGSVGRGDYPGPVVTALYRRYRPEDFSELIGQSQVTDPLRTALRADRVNHAYLFSGPRGCGKTTSARILARCLNCAQGPTDTPCGVCPSCVELARDGGGSLDVIEIDAASHNGVDDARDIRDRAVFAPARDRFKIFILDEAHMVTPQGFNALLKVVEEPPEHVKFIFATTEPDKVIGTIRSRTHHYPFRLVPPAQMLDYLHELCETEGVAAAPGVLPLVVRAGGGSVRDTLSLLDQLMAGSEGGEVGYERAVALLGYTHAALLDDVVDALAARDGAAAFAAVDRVVQTGQDPRRFVEDLLERLRDLIVVGATAEGAGAVLRGVTPDELDRLGHQAAAFGPAELSRSADVVSRALTDMTGATSPRLHLELMIARVLVPESDESTRGALARVERLERRVGVQGDGPAAGAGGASGAADPSRGAPTAAVRADDPESRAASAGPVAPVAPGRGAATPPTSAAETATASWSAASPGTGSSGTAPSGGADPGSGPGPTSGAAPARTSSRDDVDRAPASEPAPPTAAHSAAWAQTPPVESAAPADPVPGQPVGPVSLQQLRDAWPEIVEVVEGTKRTAWLVVVTATPVAYADDVLTLTFPSAVDVDAFKKPQGAGEGVSEHLRRAIQQVLGVRVKYIAKVEGPAEGSLDARRQEQAAGDAPARPAGTDEGRGAPGPAAPAGAAPAAPPAAAAPQGGDVAGPRGTAPGSASASSAAPQGRPQRAPAPAPAAAPVTGWDVAPIPQSAPPEPDEPEHITEEPPGGAPVVDAAPAPAAAPAGTATASGPAPSSTTASPTRDAAAPAGRASTPVAQRAAAAGDPRRGIPAGSRYGEAVVREILGAQFLHEETVAPRQAPPRPE